MVGREGEGERGGARGLLLPSFTFFLSFFFFLYLFIPVIFFHSVYSLNSFIHSLLLFLCSIYSSHSLFSELILTWLFLHDIQAGCAAVRSKGGRTGGRFAGHSQAGAVLQGGGVLRLF